MHRQPLSLLLLLLLLLLLSMIDRVVIVCCFVDDACNCVTAIFQSESVIAYLISFCCFGFPAKIENARLRPTALVLTGMRQKKEKWW